MKRELTKWDIYVVIDTPKKAKKLKKVLEMFGENIYESTNKRLSNSIVSEEYPTITFIFGDWAGHGSKSITSKTKVSIKELRNILAKEHLKKGDYVVCEDNGVIAVGIFKEWEYRFGFEVENCYCLGDTYNDYTGMGGCFENFKRYATPEEIELLEPQQGLCSLCKSKLGIK